MSEISTCKPANRSSAARPGIGPKRFVKETRSLNVGTRVISVYIHAFDARVDSAKDAIGDRPGPSRDLLGID